MTVELNAEEQRVLGCPLETPNPPNGLSPSWKASVSPPPAEGCGSSLPPQAGRRTARLQTRTNVIVVVLMGAG